MDLKINSKTTFGCKLSTNLEKRCIGKLKLQIQKEK